MVWSLSWSCLAAPCVSYGNYSSVAAILFRRLSHRPTYKDDDPRHDIPSATIMLLSRMGRVQVTKTARYTHLLGSETSLIDLQFFAFVSTRDSVQLSHYHQVFCHLSFPFKRLPSFPN